MFFIERPRKLVESKNRFKRQESTEAGDSTNVISDIVIKKYLPSTHQKGKRNLAKNIFCSNFEFKKVMGPKPEVDNLDKYSPHCRPCQKVDFDGGQEMLAISHRKIDSNSKKRISFIRNNLQSHGVSVKDIQFAGAATSRILDHSEKIPEQNEFLMELYVADKIHSSTRDFRLTPQSGERSSISIRTKVRAI